jgi:hypothetical protein
LVSLRSQVADSRRSVVPFRSKEQYS